MPSDYPKDMLPRAPNPAIPYVRILAFTGGFFTVLAVLLIAMRFVPIVPAV